MVQRSFLNEILSRVSRQSWTTPDTDESADQDIITLTEQLLANASEASGLMLAREILDRFEALNPQDATAFFVHLATGLGQDDDAIRQEIANWSEQDSAATRQLHFASEPRSQDLIRILNRVPGATQRLVAMRAALLQRVNDHPELASLDLDFKHLFSSWFNRGFLEIRRIEWSTSAAILEKIIAYEAVHEISGWNDLRRRVGDPDRRLFAFFHPAMPTEPLIFVEVALTNAVPSAIGPILSDDRVRSDPEQATTAVFYSISNCHAGLRGISFGNFLIKQVVSELLRELPQLTTFVTLSPVPGLRRWIEHALKNNDPLLTEAARDVLHSLSVDDVPPPVFCTHIAALYLTRARHALGSARDPVAHFHLGNGAELHAVHSGADQSRRGFAAAWGVMVNYLYDGATVDQNHQAYAADYSIAASENVLAAIAKTKEYRDV